MRTYRDLFSQTGNRKQYIVSDAEHIKDMMQMPPALKFGRIRKVYAFDDMSSPQINKTGAFTTYQIALMPEGTILENVPSCYGNGHFLDYVTPNAAPLNQQNTEEISFVIGQTVLIGFVNNSNLNPLIICAVSCPYNAGTQSAAEYPQKTSVFQGSSDVTDKNGNRTINLAVNGTFTFQINGQDFLILDGVHNKVILGDGMHTGAWGDVIQTFLNSLKSAYDSHTHSGVQTGGGFSGTPVSSSPSVPPVSSSFMETQ